MEISILIARAFGFLMLFVGVGILLNLKHYLKIFTSLAKNNELFIYAGAINIILSITLLHYHNIWELSWRVLITISIWIALIKGLTFIFLPKKQSKLIKKFVKNRNTLKSTACLAVIIGLIFIYFGFANEITTILN